jgi:hypothetical protein
MNADQIVENLLDGSFDPKSAVTRWSGWASTLQRLGFNEVDEEEYEFGKGNRKLVVNLHEDGLAAIVRVFEFDTTTGGWELLQRDSELSMTSAIPIITSLVRKFLRVRK